MKKILLTLGLLTVVSGAQAVIYTTNWSVGVTVPDNNLSGWANSQLISVPAGTIDPGSLQVSLELTGGWNGDLYAYLANSSGGFCVLLDRVGTPGATYGYGDAGMNVTFTSGATTNIHAYGGGFVPNGSYLPDDSATTTASGSLSSFVNPNGTWTLFVADLSGGGVSTVQSWGLQMDIVAVPEIESWIAAALAGAFGAFWVNRQIWRGVKRPADGRQQ